MELKFKSSSVYSNRTLRHASRNLLMWIRKCAVRNLKPEYAKRTRLVVFVYAGTIVNIKAFTAAKVHSSIPWQMFNGKCVKN